MHSFCHLCFSSCFVMNFASLCEELYNWLNGTATDNEVIRPISKQFLNSCPKILKPLSYCNIKYLFLFFITTDWSTIQGFKGKPQLSSEHLSHWKAEREGHSRSPLIWTAQPKSRTELSNQTAGTSENLNIRHKEICRCTSGCLEERCCIWTRTCANQPVMFVALPVITLAEFPWNVPLLWWADTVTTVTRACKNKLAFSHTTIGDPLVFAYSPVLFHVIIKHLKLWYGF